MLTGPLTLRLFHRSNALHELKGKKLKISLELKIKSNTLIPFLLLVLNNYKYIFL